MLHRHFANLIDYLAATLALCAMHAEHAIGVAWDNMPQIAGFLSASWMAARILIATKQWWKNRQEGGDA